ncbi:MAG: PAS domain-containing protein [Bacillota bacterium]
MKTKVFSREKQEFKEVAITDSDKKEISYKLLSKWQNIMDITAEIVGVSAALIMKIKPDSIDVLLKSQNDDNPYKAGDSEALGSGLYCETVIAQNDELYIKNALKDESWNNNPDINLDMISYYGLPLNWPDEESFGTICILDNTEIKLDNKYKKLFKEFKNIIEEDLNLLLNEKQLEKKELEKLFEINLDLLITANMQGEILKVNEVWEDLLGFSQNDLEGAKFLDLVHPEDYKFTRKAMKKLGNDQKINNFINRLRDKEGNYHFIEWNTTPYGKEFYGSGRDITDKIVQTEKIKRQKKRLDWIIEGTDAGSWQWNIQTGKTIFNDKWAEILGYSLEEISPTTIETWEKLVHPEDLKKAKKETKKHLRGETKQYNVELRMKHKDGHWIWVNDRGKLISWTKDNKPLKMFGIHLDIDQRKKQERELEFQFQIQKLLAELSLTFSNIHTAGFNNKIELILKRIGNFFKLDRGYLFHLTEGDNKKENNYCWCSNEVQIQKNKFQNIPIDIFNYWQEELLKGEIINIQDIENMGTEAVEIKKILSRKNIKSAVINPIYIEDELSYILGFDSVKKRNLSEHDIKLLNIITENITQAFSKSLQEEKIKLLNKKLNTQINKTAEVHENNFLANIPEPKNISLATYYNPAERVGGDFYNFIEFDNKLIFYLSDITGHGLEGVVFNSFIRDIIDNYVELAEKPIKLDKLLKYIYKKYMNNNFPDDYFICLFIGILDLDTLKMKYASRGFQFPPLILSQKGAKKFLPNSGMPISSVISEELMNFEFNSYNLNSALSLIFYTDGIVEQMQNKSIYHERFKKIFYSHGDLSAEEIKHKILEDFKEFNNGSLRAKDDVTFFIIKNNN